MDAERWQRVKAAFQAAIECEPAEREAMLASACEGDVDLRQAVERLLRADAGATSFLAGSPADHLDGAEGVDMAPPPSRIGPYRVVRELGRGGMGTVYLAEREEGGFEKRVAIKVVSHGMQTELVLRRFRTERQILAALDHPGIARLYDGGTTENGLPYFVMEYVDGENILAYCDARHQSIADRLRLFRRICNAVQFAHQSFIVHRDLKPSNILVTAEGNPKLLDFGIAKLTTAQPGGDEPPTMTMTRVMTFEYASPEQIRGERVTTASDVYSLGVILYQLLTGRRPYRFKSRHPSEIERAVSEHEPDAPSAVVMRPDTQPAREGAPPITITPERVSANRGTLPARLRRALRGDLDNIVLKALHKDETRRYATAAELGDDLGNYLEGRPVHAQPDRRLYRLSKFVRRHRVATAAVAVAAVALLTGLGVALWQARAARAERDRARVEAAKAREVSAFMRGLFASAAPGKTGGRKLTAQDLLDAGAARVDKELAGQPEVQAAMLAALGSVYSEMSLFPQAVPLLERSLALREEHLDPNHPDVAESLSLLGNTRSRLGEYATAHRLLERAVSLREQAVPRDNVALGAAWAQLSQNLWRMGELDSARTALARALAIDDKGDPRLLMRRLTSLATIDVGLDEPERARQGFERVLKMNQAIGDGDAAVAVALLNLGNLLYEQEDYAGARALIARGVAADEKIYGAESQGGVYGYGELGYVHLLLGDRARARALIEQSIATGEKLLGPNHRELAPPLTYLGRLHVAEGRPREALPLFERVLRHREETLGPKHVDVAETLIDIAAARVALRDPAAAEPLLRRALAIQRAALRSGHRLLVPTLTALGQALVQQGRATEARPLFEEAVTIARAKLHEKHSKRRAAEAALRSLQP